MSPPLPRFVSPGEITNDDLTVGEMRAFMRDSREDFRWLREELAPAIVEIRSDLRAVRRHQVELDKRVAALEAAAEKKPIRKKART